jgi:putative spermidine/putrescine transport system ATP-binding protein
MNILELRNLKFEYPRESGRKNFTLDAPELFVEKGSNMALFGESGSGKSTLLRICAGLLKGCSGEVRLFGSILDLSKSRRDTAVLSRTAILFQDAPLFDCPVFDNIAIGLKIRKTPAAEINSAVGAIMEKLNISGLARAHSREISGGQARRVCLARVLVLKPELLFLDEPFYSLDTNNRSQIMHELKSMCSELAVTLMLVTHDKNEALALCQNIAVIDGGSIIRRGSVRECFNNPASEAEAKLLGRSTILYGRVVKCESEVAEIECAANGGGSEPMTIQAAGSYPAGERVCVIINPQDISVGLKKEGRSEDGDSSSVLNNYDGVIESGMHYEFGMLVNILTGSDTRLQAYITSKSFEKLGIAPGLAVKVSVKATSVKSFPMP